MIGVCELCQVSAELVRDHCHKSGYLRGLICAPCNGALPERWSDPIWKQRALEYLNQNKGVLYSTHKTHKWGPSEQLFLVKYLGWSVSIKRALDNPSIWRLTWRFKDTLNIWRTLGRTFTAPSLFDVMRQIIPFLRNHVDFWHGAISEKLLYPCADSLERDFIKCP